MNIEKLKEAIELMKLLDDENEEKNETIASSNILSEIIGKYVICRTINEGINFGLVVKADATGIHLKECRRFYYYEPLNKSISWYEGVAASGLSSNSKVSSESEKIIIENYSVTLCSYEAVRNIKGFKDYEQS